MNIQNSRIQSQFGENSSLQSRGGQNMEHRIMCGEHQGYGITHFCSKISCLKALCQKCIKDHNTYHKEKREYSEIETVEDINQECQQRIQKCLKDYSDQQEQVYQQLQAEDQHHKSFQVISRINEAENQCQNIVQSYFNTLKKEYDIAQRKMDGEKSKIDTQLLEVESEKAKLQEYFRELQENQFQVSTLQFILKLDFRIFMNEKLQMIGQYFEQLALATPNININFENIHRLIFDICQNACYLSYSDQSPKQRTVSQIRSEYANNNSRKVSTNTNNIQNLINNSSSQFSQQSERNNGELGHATASVYQQKNVKPSYSVSPGPDSRLNVHQQQTQKLPSQQNKIPYINMIDSQVKLDSSQNDDRYTPINNKIKQKIFETKPNLLSSPRPPYTTSQQQSLKQSMVNKNEDSKLQSNQFTQNQSNILQPNNISSNNNLSQHNITPNFHNSKSSNPYNTGWSSINSNIPNNLQTFDQQLSNRINTLNNQNIQPTYTSYTLAGQNENKNYNNNTQYELPHNSYSNSNLNFTSNNQYNPINNKSELDNNYKSISNPIPYSTPNNPQSNNQSHIITQDYNSNSNIQGNSYNPSNINAPNYQSNRQNDNNAFYREDSFNPTNNLQNQRKENQYQSQQDQIGLSQIDEFPMKQEGQQERHPQNTYLSTFDNKSKNNQNNISPGSTFNPNTFNSKVGGANVQSQIRERDIEYKEFEISMNNYFKADSTYQYLHFFQPKSNILHIVNISDLKQASSGISTGNYLKFYDINMKSDDPSFVVPRFHKSLSLRDGSIYLIGGISPSSSHSPLVYKYDFSKNKLNIVSQMNTGRSGFGCVYSPFNNSIYVIGGAIDDDGITNQCERYDLNTNKWTSISFLNNPTFNPAVCYFTANGRHFIYKFGGKIDDNNLDQTIERYDLQNDTWEVILTNNQIPLLLSSSNCCQINNQQIMVFGGTNTNTSEKSSSCFLLYVERDPMNKNQLVHSVQGINKIDLPNAEGFSSQQSFIHDNQLFTVQNVSEKKKPDIIYLDRKRIISFNSYSWMVLNSIELLEKNN